MDSFSSKKYIIIMAGGSGTRMNSTLPKQLLTVGKDPMIVHLLKHAAQLCFDVLLVVSEKNKLIITKTLSEGRYILQKESDNIFSFMNINIIMCIQPISNGTGGAIMATIDFLKQCEPDDQVVVLSADVPLITKRTIINMFEKLNDNVTQCVILAKESTNNFGYGRIVVNNAMFVKIVEHKDCTLEEKNITMINTGVYGFKIQALIESLKHLNTNNSQKEYYLTDCPKYINESSYIPYNGLISENTQGSGICIGIGGIGMRKQLIKIIVPINHKFDETMGANTPEQLQLLREEYWKKFTIEAINESDENMTSDNLGNLLRVLEQLTVVNTIDTEKVRNYIKKLTECQVNKKHLLIMKYEHDIIGTGSILIEDKIIHEMGKIGHIEDVVIDKSFRELGLSKKLLQELIEIGKNNDCYKIMLNSSDELKFFYEKFGFFVHGNNMRMNL